MKRVLACLFTLALVGTIVGCTTANNQTQNNAEPISNEQQIKHIDDWKDIYPDVYASFIDGANDKKDKDGLSHSHAVLKDTAEVADAIFSTTSDGMGCVSCKSADLNTLYAEHGDNVWAMPYADHTDDLEFWGCYLCHENNPSGTVMATSITYKTLAGDYVDTIAPADAACGQCHNALAAYPRRVVFSGKALQSLDPYRYGTDADALYKAFTEDGDPLLVDEDGVESYSIGHPDVEIYQGSNHQSLGLTCASCHMPSMTNSEGEAYISHNASGSPLENQSALEYCLTCHSAQGIENTNEMVGFVKGKQEILGTANTEAQTSLDELHALIVANADTASDSKEARELYTLAKSKAYYQPAQKAAESEIMNVKSMICNSSQVR